MLGCLFCDFFNGTKPKKIIATYTHCYVIEDEFPVSKGHLLIIPNKHTENWFTASFDVKEDIIKALDEMKIKLDEQYHPDGYNVGMNCGTTARQSVYHLHVHLIPRYQGDVENPKGGVRGVIPSKQGY